MQIIGWWNKTMNYFEDFEQKYRFTIRPEILVTVFLVFWLIHKGRESFGDILPNPINIFNHIGNVDSVAPALITGLLVGIIASRTLRLEKRRLLNIGVMSGVAMGFVSNVFIEITFGMRILGQYNVSDPLDVVWGTIFCLAACLAVFTVRQKR